MLVNIETKVNDLISTNEYVKEHTTNDVLLLNFYSVNFERV